MVLLSLAIVLWYLTGKLLRLRLSQVRSPTFGSTNTSLATISYIMKGGCIYSGRGWRDIFVFQLALNLLFFINNIGFIFLVLNKLRLLLDR